MLRIRGSSIRRGEADDGDDGDDQHKGRTDERDSGDTHATPDWGWGATVDLHKKAASTPGESNKYEVSVLVLCSKESKPKDGHQGNQVKQDKDGARDRGQQDGIPTPAPNGFQVVLSIAKIKTSKQIHLHRAQNVVDQWGADTH